MIFAVRAPANLVFEFLADPERYAFPAGTTFSKDPEGLTELGSVFTISDERKRVTYTWKVVQFERPSRLAWAVSRSGAALVTTMSITETGDHTLVVSEAPLPRSSRFAVIDTVGYLVVLPILWLGRRRMERLLRSALEPPNR
jgi:hypothetical protein